MVDDGLRQGLDSIIALELRLEEALTRLADETREFLEAPVMIEQLHSLVAGQRKALGVHVRGLATTDVPPIGPAISAALQGRPGTPFGEQDPLAKLRDVAAAFAEIAVGYGLIHALAHRSYDITTANLADEHRRAYLRAAETLHWAVGDVAVQELQDSGHACRCQCPACSPGVCICWHVHVEPDEGGEESLTEGIVVRTPRGGSNAELAGLRRGDVILAVDDHVVRSYDDMRDGLGRHQLGEEMKLRIRRRTGEQEDVIIKR